MGCVSRSIRQSSKIKENLLLPTQPLLPPISRVSGVMTNCPTVYIMSVITVGDCIKSLEKMKFPWVIVMPFAICFRFLPALAHEGRIIRDALRVRGLFSWPRAVTHPLRTGELFLVTLLFRSIAIGEELSFSVSTRAAGQRRHVWYREKSLGPMDLAFTFLVLGTMTAILVAPWQGILPAWFASLESV